MSVRKARKRLSEAARNAGVSCVKKRGSIERDEAKVASDWVSYWRIVRRLNGWNWRTK